MTSEIRILRYLWAGLKLNGKEVVTPNGRVVQAVRQSTFANLLAPGWITPDGNGYYTLTAEGRARALVKQRVEDFLTDLTNQPTT